MQKRFALALTLFAINLYGCNQSETENDVSTWRYCDNLHTEQDCLNNNCTLIEDAILGSYDSNNQTCSLSNNGDVVTVCFEELGSNTPLRGQVISTYKKEGSSSTINTMTLGVDIGEIQNWSNCFSSISNQAGCDCNE